MASELRQVDDPVGGLAALEPELENYLARLSPSSRRSLRKQASGKSPKQQRALLAALQYGDNEFQGAVQDYMPEGAGPVDPLVARFHGVPTKDESNFGQYYFSGSGSIMGQHFPPDYGYLEGDISPSLDSFARGLGYESYADMYRKRNPPFNRSYGKSGTKYMFPNDPDTVNTYGAINATPNIWAHEYRHQQDLEGMAGETNLVRDFSSVLTNRVQDIINAETPRDLRTALVVVAGTLQGVQSKVVMGLLDEEIPEELSKEADKFLEYAQEVEWAAMDKNTPHEELVRHARKILSSKFIQNQFEVMQEHADHQANLRQRNTRLEPLPLNKRMTREDFKEGRIYKNEIEDNFLRRLRKAMRDS